MPQKVHLTWHGPFSFFSDQEVPCVFHDNIATICYGVYLWTIEHEGSHLINYVGKTYGRKTTRTFAKRFEEELQYERDRGLRVEVDLFFQGIRSCVPWHHDRVEVVLKAYRIFFAPLPDLGNAVFKNIEGALINALYDAGGKYGQFLANPRCRRSFDGELTMDPADVLGLDRLHGTSLSAVQRIKSSASSVSHEVFKDTKALDAVRRFFSVRWNAHGKKRTSGDREG